jgi:antitoxin YefM
MNTIGANRSMLSGIKQKAIVGKDGKIELSATEIPEGTVVEVIVILETSIEDDTTYLLKSVANKERLLKTVENVKAGNLIYVDLDEYEKHFIETKLEDVAGCLKYQGNPKTLDDMDNAIHQGVKELWNDCS